jgi:hypothetical protein
LEPWVGKYDIELKNVVTARMRRAEHRLVVLDNAGQRLAVPQLVNCAPHRQAGYCWVKSVDCRAQINRYPEVTGEQEAILFRRARTDAVPFVVQRTANGK